MQELQFLVEFITAVSGTINKQYCDFPRAQCCTETLFRFFPADISFCCWHETCFHDPYPCGEKKVILHQFVYYPSASSDFCEFPCGIFTGGKD